MQVLSSIVELDVAAVAKVALVCLAVSLLVALLEPGIRHALWSIFNFVAALFAFAARATLTFIHFSAAKIAEAIDGLAEEGQYRNGKARPWLGWLIIGPIIYCVLLLTFMACDVTVAGLIFQAMGLTLGSSSLLNIPISIDATLAVVFVALAVFFGIVLFDLLQITPFSYIWSGLGDRARRTLLRVVLLCLAIELVAALAMGVWSQAQLTGGMPQPWQTVLPWLIRGCLVLLLVSATALSGKPSGSAITAAGVVGLILARAVAYLVLILLRLVLVFLRQIIHIPLALVGLIALLGHKLWNWIAGFRWGKRLNLRPLTITPLAELGGEADSPLIFRGAGAATAAQDSADLAEANKQLMRRIYQDVFPSADARLEDFFALDLVNNDAPATARTGIGALRQFLVALRTQFHDLAVEVEDQVAEGEKVVSRMVLVGTQQGPFRAMRQQPVRIPCVDSVRVHEHKVVERWGTLLRPDLLQPNPSSGDLESREPVEAR